MLVHRLNALIRGQRGVALPMALLTMLILSALIIAFSMMAASEPVLANNQLQVAQARAVAESGVQRAIWALNNGGIPDPFVTAVAPYDNSVAIPVTVNGAQIGVFTVAVTPGAALYERNITATGWTPTNTGSGPKVKQVIQVTVFKIGFGNLPSPLTVRGEIDAGGHALIDARADTDPKCGGAKSGTTSKGATTTGGSAKIYGALDGGNSAANESSDITQNLLDPSVNSPWANFTYSNAELNALKALAKQNGTYYQGTQTFNASNKLKNGIVYVDTVSGLNIPANPADNSDFAQVAVHGNSELDPSGIFSGMLIVAGSLSISGTFQMHGVVYVVNDFTYMGTGAGQITGAVMSQNVLDTSATSIDTDTGGNSTIIWNCRYVRTLGDTVPPTFIIEKGSYKEIPG